MPCTPRLLKHAQNKAALINGTVKRAAKTCKLFLLESNVARFTTYESNLSCNKLGCCKQRKVLAEIKEYFCYLQQKMHMLRVLLAQGPPRTTCLVASDVTRVVYLGDPGQSVGQGEKAQRKFSSTTDRPWVSEDTFTWANRSVHGLGKWYAKFRAA